jgi:hypothetical protein
MKQVALTDLFEKASENVGTAALVVCTDPLPRTSRTFSALKTRKTQRSKKVNPKNEINEISERDTPARFVVHSKYRNGNKNYLKTVGQ